MISKMNAKIVKRIAVLVLLLTMSTGVTFANKNHWFYPVSLEMQALKLIDSSDVFYKGAGFTD
ncbi:MAG TPA: hypothetical protein DCS67_06980 [Clostridiales bacterium UBA8960]|nr:hypothetical protein [Clostridiales bacterium UBA8960]